MDEREKVKELHWLTFAHIRNEITDSAYWVLRNALELAEISGDWEYYRGIKEGKHGILKRDAAIIKNRKHIENELLKEVKYKKGGDIKDGN
jgi:hypothetical protein